MYVYVGAVLYIMSCNHPSIHTHGIPDMYVKAYIYIVLYPILKEILPLHLRSLTHPEIEAPLNM